MRQNTWRWLWLSDSLSLKTSFFVFFLVCRFMRLPWRYSTVLLTIVPLRCSSVGLLHIQNGCCPRKIRSCHLPGMLSAPCGISTSFSTVMFMWAQKVIIGDPESQIIVGTVDVIKVVCITGRSFVDTVQTSDHLFGLPVFGRYSIVVGKSNDLSDLEFKYCPEFTVNSIVARV